VGTKAIVFPAPLAWEENAFISLIVLMTSIFSDGDGLFRSHRNEIPCPFPHLFDLSYQLVEILFSVYEINLAGIDDQKGGLIVVKEIIVIGFDQRLEIL
jgi:hypothetical protein